MHISTNRHFEIGDKILKKNTLFGKRYFRKITPIRNSYDTREINVDISR